jgi:hypothetical protein
MMQTDQCKQLQHSIINSNTKQTSYITPPGDGGLGGQRACGEKFLLSGEMSY